MTPQLSPSERSRLFALLPKIKAEDRRQRIAALVARVNASLGVWRRS